jgi:hypothetical protein
MADSEAEYRNKQLDLEREKARADLDFRNRDLQLRQREQDTRDADLALRRTEQERSRWANPLTVAVSAAGLAALGSAVVAWWNGRLQRVIEAERAGEQQRLESYRAESDRILETIKTGNSESAAENLSFLLKTGLIETPTLVNRLRDFLQSRQPGKGPALPSPTTQFSMGSTENLSRGAQEELQTELLRFIEYLGKVGFSTQDSSVKIEFDLDVLNAWYDGNTIRIGWRIANDLDVLRSTYARYVLGLANPGIDSTYAIYWALGDYFSCSFKSGPTVGRIIAAFVAEAGGKGDPYLRNLENSLPCSELFRRENPQQGGEVLGGAFWAIRKAVGQEAADSLLLSAWRSLSPSQAVETTVGPEVRATVPDRVDMITAAVIACADRTGDSKLSADVRRVFKERGFPVEADTDLTDVGQRPPS